MLLRLSRLNKQPCRNNPFAGFACHHLGSYFGREYGFPLSGGVTAASASAYLTRTTHYTTLNCPGGVACNLEVGRQGGNEFDFLPTTYYYTWQNFYFQPARNGFQRVDDEEMASTQIQKMEVEAVLKGGTQSPLGRLPILQHLDGRVD